MSPHIQALYVHPIKSCAALAPQSVELTATGLAHDREWMIVDEAGRFLTQRDVPRMAQVQPAIADGLLRLAVPGVQGPSLPLGHEGERVQVHVWRSRCAAFDAGEPVAQFLSGFLGRKARLVRFDPAHRRLSNGDWTAGIRAPNLFSDGYPLLIIAAASLTDLNARLERALPMNRFRPNIVLGDVPAYAEDATQELEAGAVRIRLTKPCTRCVITTTDQDTGTRDGDEPLRTLKAYRHDKALRGVTFGRNAVIAAGQGASLSVGQPVVLR